MCDFFEVFMFRGCRQLRRYSLWMSPVSGSCQPATASVSTATIKGYGRSMFSSVTCIYEPNSQVAKFISSLLKPEWWLLGSTDVATSFVQLIPLPLFSLHPNRENRSHLSVHTFIIPCLYILWHVFCRACAVQGIDEGRISVNIRSDGIRRLKEWCCRDALMVSKWDSVCLLINHLTV